MKNPFNSLGSFAYNTLTNPVGEVRNITNGLGITSPPPPDLSKGPDATAIRNFAGQLVNEYNNRQPGSTDTGWAQASRGVQSNAINKLEGVANGNTTTAADALLQQGTDQAARTGMGTAAQYSAFNPGEALRMGLAAGTDAGNKAATAAALQKAQEQATARQQLIDAATQMRQGDLSQQGNLLTQQQVNNTNANNLRTAAGTELNAPLAAAQANLLLQQQNIAGNQTALGGLIGTGAKLLDNQVPSPNLSNPGLTNPAGGNTSPPPPPGDGTGNGLMAPTGYSNPTAGDPRLLAARAFTGGPGY